MYLLGKHIRVTGDERKCVGIVRVIFNHFCLFPVVVGGSILLLDVYIQFTLFRRQATFKF